MARWRFTQAGGGMAPVPVVVPIDYTDTGTALVDLQITSVEIREISDANTVLVDLQASGTEYITHETIDTDTILVDLQSSGTEYITHETVDSATVNLDLQVVAPTVAFPTTPVLDDFNRADETPLSQSGAWDGPVRSGRSRLRLISNAAARASSGSTSEDYRSGTSFTESEAYCTVAALPNTTDFALVLARIQSPETAGADFYGMEVVRVGANNYSFTAYRVDDAVFTSLGVVATGVDLQVGHKFGLQVTGTGATVTLRSYMNTGSGWAQLGSDVSDSSGSRITSPGPIGLSIGGVTGSLWRLDDFGGGEKVPTPDILLAVDSAEVYLDLQVVEGAAAPITFVKDAYQATGFVANVNVTVPAGGFAVGNLLIAFISHTSVGTTVNTITDDSGNTWTEIDELVAGGGNVNTYVWQTVVTNALDASDNIQVALSTSGGAAVMISEFSGLAASPLDQLENGHAFTTTHSSGLTGTTAQANELVFGAYFSDNHSDAFTIGGSYTQLETQSPFGVYRMTTMYKIVSAIDEYEADGTTSIARTSSIHVATFKGAPAGSQDTFHGVDQGTVLIDLQSSGTDEYTPVGGIETTDSATVPFDLQSSGTELREVTDANTVLIDLQGSGTEYITHETIDTAEAYVDLQSSGTEYITHETIDSATASLDLQVVTPIAVSASDDFNRANGALTAPWVQSGPGTVSISSNKIVNGTPGEHAFAYYSGAASSADQFAEATIGDAIDCESGPAVRISGSGTAYNSYFVNPGFQALQKTVAGSYTNLGGLGTPTPTDGDVVRIEVQGNQIRVYLNAVEVENSPFTDSSLTTGQPGVRVWDDQLDDWSGGDLAAAPADILIAVDSATATIDLQASGTEERTVTDLATTYFDLQAITTLELREISDAATVPLDLQSSGTELREITDAAEAYVDLQSSGTEEAAYVETAEAYVDLQPSADEQYVPSTGAEYTDSATGFVDLQAVTTVEEYGRYDAAEAYVDLQHSGSDILEAVDAATTYFDLQSSGTELREVTDSATTYFDLSPSGVDVATFADAQTVLVELETSGTEQREVTDQATVPLDLQISDVQIFAAIDTETVLIDLQPSADEQYVPSTGAEYTDAATANFDLQSSGTEERTVTDAAETYIDLQSSGTEERTVTDADTTYFDLQASATEFREISDAATVPFDLQSSGTEIREIVDTATVPFDLQASGTDVLVAVDAAEPYLDLQASGIDEKSGEKTDAATVLVDLQNTAVEVLEAVDAASLYLDLQITSVEVPVYAEAATAYFDLLASGTEFREILEAATTYFDLQAISAELAEYVETAQTYFNLQSISQEIAEYIDAAEFLLDLQASGTEFREILDATQTYFDLQPSGVELIDLGDFGTAYLDLLPTGVEERIAVDLATVYLDLQVLAEPIVKAVLSGILLGRKWGAAFGNKWRGRQINRWSR